MTDPVRALHGRAGANKRWSQIPSWQRAEATAPARRGLIAKFEREIDPDGALPADERARLGHQALTAHMQSLAAKKSAAARRRRAS